MHNQRVALVTGANQGIGLQIAKDLAGHGLTVLVGARDLGRGEAAARSIGGDARAIALDVTDAASIAAAAARIHHELGRLDLLVNNAAISHAGAPGRPLPEVIASNQPSVASIGELRRVFETNVIGVVAVTQAMLPLLRASPAARIVNVSSTVGSLTYLSDPKNPYRSVGGVAYGPSKTALNAITLAFATELEGSSVKINLVCPGYTATALNDFQGPRTVEQAAREPVRLALLGPDGPSGTFSNEDGLIPW
jgi:NAD(P)-dependent dehydrogenase (short-subunit alcohol dehydrogenase family)